MQDSSAAEALVASPLAEPTASDSLVQLYARLDSLSAVVSDISGFGLGDLMQIIVPVASVAVAAWAAWKTHSIGERSLAVTDRANDETRRQQNRQALHAQYRAIVMDPVLEQLDLFATNQAPKIAKHARSIHDKRRQGYHISPIEGWANSLFMNSFVATFNHQTVPKTLAPLFHATLGIAEAWPGDKELAGKLAGAVTMIGDLLAEEIQKQYLKDPAPPDTNTVIATALGRIRRVVVEHDPMTMPNEGPQPSEEQDPS